MTMCFTKIKAVSNKTDALRREGNLDFIRKCVIIYENWMRDTCISLT
jgi:hypothetical protein